MGKFDGKVFLELGSSMMGADMVKYAKSEGAHVIVTDYLPTEKSEAKQYADETAMISTLDVDALIAFAREKKINGVFCGASEANLRSVRVIAEALKLPCYFTQEQWDICQDKIAFKAYCEEYGVPVPKSFVLSNEPTEDELAAVEYPVIVKPVDQRAGIGVHICRSEQELLDGYRDACEKSFSQRATVEQYLEGVEFYAYYVVSDGEYALAEILEVCMNRSNELPIPVTDMFVVHISPDQVVGNYLQQINDKLIDMMKSTGFRNGTFFVQGIRQNDKLTLFEAGLRLPGGKTFDLLAHVKGVNTTQAMIDYALTGKMGIDITRMDITDENTPGKDRTCLTFCILCRAGVIGRIEGLEDAIAMCGGVKPKIFHQVGDIISMSVPLGSRLMIACVVENSLEEAVAKMQIIRDAVKVWDENGESMIIPPEDALAFIQDNSGFD